LIYVSELMASDADAYIVGPGVILTASIKVAVSNLSLESVS